MDAYFVTIVIGVALALVLARRARGADRAEAATLTASSLAERLGLAIVDGDPDTDLATLARDADRPRPGERRGDRRRLGVAMRGAPRGRTQSFHYFVESTASLTDTTIVTDFVLRTEVRAAFADFEVSRRRPTKGFEVRAVLSAPVMPTGHAETDAALCVRTHDPALARLLGPRLAPLAAHAFVHVYGMNGSLYCVASHESSAYAAAHVEEVARLHHTVAEALDAIGAPRPSQPDTQPSTR